MFEALAGIEKAALDAQAAANPIRSEADLPRGEAPEGDIFAEADRELREEAAERERLKEIDKPLETPPVDPIDLLGPGSLGASLLKGIARGVGNFLSKKIGQAILGESVEKAITQGAKEGVEAIIPRASFEAGEAAAKKAVGEGVETTTKSAGKTAAQRGALELGGFAKSVGPDEIAKINRSFGGATTLPGGSIESVLSGASRFDGFFNKAASVIRGIAGQHLFDNGNKRTAQAVYDLLKARNGISTGVSADQVRKIIGQVAKGELKDITQIAKALRGF